MSKTRLALPFIVTVFALIAVACSNTPAPTPIPSLPTPQIPPTLIPAAPNPSPTSQPVIPTPISVPTDTPTPVAPTPTPVLPIPGPPTDPNQGPSQEVLDELQAELDANREKWASNGMSDYEYELRRVCFCPREIVGPVIVSVTNGEIGSITLAETELPVKEDFRDLYPSIKGLFDFVQDAIDRKAVSINASYDPELGYPTNVSVDYNRMIADEELGFVASIMDMSQPASIGGHWEGVILAGDVELGIMVDFVNGESGLSATIDIPEQFVDGLALSNVTFNDSAVHFEISESGAVFDGTLTGDTITGDYGQFGVSATFELTRTEASEEVPVVEEPVPYDEEEVAFRNGDITLAGTLTLPPGEGPHPAVVMITGSGAQNRDEEIVGFKIFGVIADHLTRNGIAVLRYDDRGVGGSAGDVMESTLEDFSDDVLSAVDLLKSRPDIDPEQIGLIGHSEGGIVGPMAASRSDDISYMVLIAGTSVTGEEILIAQLEIISRLNDVDEEEIQRALETQQLTFNAARTSEGWDEVREAARQQILDSLNELPESQRAAITDVDTFIDTVMEGQLEAAQSVWFKSFLDHDPGPVLETTTIPVLALFGGLDAQVPADLNVPTMEQALETAGNEDVTIEVFEDANHLFQRADTGNITEYAGLEKEFIAGFLDRISEWLLERVDVAVQ